MNPPARLLVSISNSIGLLKNGLFRPVPTTGAGRRIILYSWHRYGSSGNANGSSKNRPQNKELGESTIVLQEGTEFQEVPVAVIKSDLGKAEVKGYGQPLPYIDLDPTEEAAFVEGFKNFHSPQQVLEILDTIPSQEVTPTVALSILRKLFELENNFKFRNNGKSWVITSGNSSIETFARMAIVARLIDIIILGNNSENLLDALDILRYDSGGAAEAEGSAGAIDISEESEAESDYESENKNPNNPMSSREEQFSNYRSKLCDEILIRTTMGKLSLEQVIRAIIILGEMKHKYPTEIPKNFIDKMWMGILDKSNQINLDNINIGFQSLQYFKKSRRLVLSILEKKVISNWWGLSPSIIGDICDSLLLLVLKNKDTNVSSNYYGIISNRLLMSLSRSINLNLHQVKEEELIKVLNAFSTFDFCDDAITKALDKYMKAKSLKILNPNLISSVMNYTLKFKLRSKNILEGGAEYLIFHQGKNLNGPQFTSIVKPFGVLDYQPSNGFKFWETVETILNEKFIQLTPKEIISIFLSFVYIKKYPFNFTDRIFSPYFLDRLHTSETNLSLLIQSRTRLKLLDTSLTLECGSKFPGPYLPRDFTAKSVFYDGRILRMINHLLDPLGYLFKKSAYKIEPKVFLPNLPLNELYIVDVLISNKASPSLLQPPPSKKSSGDDKEPELTDPNPDENSHFLQNRINLRNHNARYFVPPKSIDLLGNGEEMIALLIHIPDHYSSSTGGIERCLLGPQVMRIRQLKLLGFTVVSLNYETLAELRVTPNALLEYLTSQINLAKSKNKVINN